MNTSKKTRASAAVKNGQSPIKTGPLEAQKQLADFCKAAGHELGNALGTIVGELDYGLSSQDPSVHTRAITVALGAATRAVSLARNLRYFALHPHLEPRPMDISQLLLDTVEIVEKDLKLQRIKVTVLVEASRFVSVDAGALQQVLLNLFTRAADTMPQGGKLSVTMRQTGKRLEICCADTGVGIPAERLANVFEAPTDRPGPLDTQALALAVVRVLVEAQQGQIRVESNAESGTTFVISLPFEPGAERTDYQGEHRRFRRVKAILPVEVSFGGRAPFLSELQTLSVRGCFIAVPEPHFAKLPDTDSLGSLRIYYYQDQVLDITKCRIASHQKSGTITGMGIEFIEFDAKSRKLLEAIVKSHSFE